MIHAVHMSNWATIFPHHHSMQCYITAKIRLSKRQYNLFRGKRRPLSIASGPTCRNILLLQSRQWLWRLCRCPHLPRVRRLTDQFTAQLCCGLRSANKICLNGDTHCSHNADFPLYRCGGACEISTNIVTNNRGSRLCHYLETFHGLLTVREHSSLWRYTAENKNCPMQNAY